MVQDGTARAFIRHAQNNDKEALLDICLRTSDAGRDGTHLYSNPHYPGLIWALPYISLCPEHAFVMVLDDRVVGYCVAATDTETFENRMEEEWWPRLRNMIANRTPSGPADKGIFSYIRKPERAHNRITALYPAHLHINLLPVAQGQGNGGRLLEHQLGQLDAAGVSGVHLGINQHNASVIPFYEKHGFSAIARSPSIIMGRCW